LHNNYISISGGNLLYQESLSFVSVYNSREHQIGILYLKIILLTISSNF
jgi:hypothetical protein